MQPKKLDGTFYLLLLKSYFKLSTNIVFEHPWLRADVNITLLISKIKIMLELQDFKDFSIHSWYEKFQNICLQTILVKVPDDFVSNIETNDDNKLNDLEKYKDIVLEIKNALNELNRNVFVKNNWHAPIDAKAFSFGNSLKVTNLDELLLYIQVSDRISADFDSIKNVPFYLALRPWLNIHPASEFRCIVINKILRGITPRDWPTFYAHYKEDGPQIIENINNFYKENIKNSFPRNNYTFDVILTYPADPLIMDFGPLNSKTNLYAFNWKEIQNIISKECPKDVAPVFRYLETDIGIMTKASALSKFMSASLME